MTDRIYRVHDSCGCDRVTPAATATRTRRAIDRFIADDNTREFNLGSPSSPNERASPSTPKWHAASLPPRRVIETGLERGKRLVVAGATDAADPPSTNIVEGHLAAGRAASAASSRLPAEGADVAAGAVVVLTPAGIAARNRQYWQPGSPARDRATPGRVGVIAATTDGAAMIVRNRALAAAMRAHYAAAAGANR